MRRVLLVVFICALSFIPGVVRADAIEGRTVNEALRCTGNANPGPEDPQNPEPPGGWWSTVCRPQFMSDVRINAPFTIPDSAALQAYEVAFTEKFGSNNGILPGEFMAVVVKKGVFALDLRGDTTAEVLVTSPAGKMVTVLRADREEYPLEEGVGLTYSASSDSEGLSCELGCRLDPEQPVLLEEGYTAILKQGTTCLICLLGETQAFETEDMATGVLAVFVLLPDTNPESFSWVADWDAYEPEPATPEAYHLPDGSDQTRFAWAFNPGNTRCGGGH